MDRIKCIAFLAAAMLPLFISAALYAQQTSGYWQCVNGRCYWVQYATPTPAVATPVAAEPAAVEPVVAELPTGVDFSKLKEGQGGYSINGQRVDRAAAFAAIEGNVPDLAGKRRIVVVGDDATRKAAIAAIGTPDWATVQAYPPDHWHVTRCGFQPGVTVCDPDGKVVHRQPTADGVAGNLARVKLLPVSEPTLNPRPYNPVIDPDLTPRVPPLIPPVLPTLPINLPSAGGGALLLLIAQWAWSIWQNRKKQSAADAAKQAERDELITKLLREKQNG